MPAEIKNNLCYPKITPSNVTFVCLPTERLISVESATYQQAKCSYFRGSPGGACEHSVLSLCKSTDAHIAAVEGLRDRCDKFLELTCK